MIDWLVVATSLSLAMGCLIWLTKEFFNRDLPMKLLMAVSAGFVATMIAWPALSAGASFVGLSVYILTMFYFDR